jgi:hypothetical protein
MHKFKVGQRVRRSPKWWPVGKHPEATNRGTVVVIKSSEDNNGKVKRAYVVTRDCNRKGVMNFFTGKIEKDAGTTYLEIELVAL